MCGIGAVLGRADADARLRQSLGMITHRGGKTFEMAAGNGFAIGANRLPIVDRQNAVQPAKNEDGRLLCVLNGEIYNYKRLKTELEEKGHKFRTESDTEVLVHMYEQYGKRMLDMIDSEIYAFAIYNTKTGDYFAARDRIGVKPLYWAETGRGAEAGGATYFASEMKQLVQFSEITEIKVVAPGHLIDNGREEKYSDLIGRKQEVEESAEEIAENVRLLLHEAVKKRVDTDLPVGVFMSGGLDSTAVLAIARKYHNNITAIIAGNEKSEDRKFALRYCQEFGVPYILVETPDEKTMWKEVRRVIYAVESFEPNVIRNSMGSHYISEGGKQFSIILCGEGADELFSGYAEFLKTSEDAQNELAVQFLSDLHRTQCQRVDRTSMQFTEEVRAPFLDTALVEYALAIPGKLKVKNGVEKWILRKALENELPDYICQRKKAVLIAGAGYKGNDPKDGMFDEYIKETQSEAEYARIVADNPDWNLSTPEEAYYFSIFQEFGYDKCLQAKERPKANRVK